MKKFILLLTYTVAAISVSMAGNRQINENESLLEKENSEYILDNDNIEKAFANATEISLQDIDLFSTKSLELSANMQKNTGKSFGADINPWGAFAIAFFLGEFGIHRMYLGSTKYMWACYTVSCCGIFGIVPFVDWIVLLVGAIQKDINSYINNPKFIMWM